MQDGDPENCLEAFNGPFDRDVALPMAELPLKFLVDLVGHDRDTEAGLNASLYPVEDRSHFQVGL